MEDFNKGEEVRVGGEFKGFESLVLEIRDVKVLLAKDVDHPLTKAVAAGNEGDTKQVIEFTFWIEDLKVEHKEYQVLVFTKKDNTPLVFMPRGEYNDKATAAMLAYDIIHAAKAFDPEQKQLEVQGFSREKFVGLKFEMGVKSGYSNKTEKAYIILETDRQVLQNEEYAASDEANSEKLDVVETANEKAAKPAPWDVH